MNNPKRIEIHKNKFTKRNFKQTKTTTITHNPTAQTKLFRTSLPYQKLKITEKQSLNCKYNEVFRIKFDRKLEHVPGDSIGLFVENRDEVVDDFMNNFGFRNVFFEAEKVGFDNYFFCGDTRSFLKLCDFKVFPKKAFLDAISCCEEIDFLCSAEGNDEYHRLFKEGATIVDFAHNFNVKIDLDVFVSYAELIKPRFFSLTHKNSDNAEIIVGSVVNGHVTEYIQRTKIGDEVEYYLKSNKLFRLNDSTKILCIATGTGIAPFYSFFRNKTEKQNLWLIYGCRNTEDNLSTGIVGDVDLALSSSNVYVMDVMESKFEKLKVFLEEGSVFVCGNRKVQKSVFLWFKNNFTVKELEGKLYFDDWR